MAPPFLGSLGRLARNPAAFLRQRAAKTCYMLSVDCCVQCSVKLLGPVLILAASSLVGGCVAGFFWWLIPYHYPEATDWRRLIWSFIGAWLSILIGFNYYAAVSVKPGSPPSGISDSATNDRENTIQGHDSDIDDDEYIGGHHEHVIHMDSMGAGVGRRRRVCKRCQCIKYERQHHCSICDRCIYKMDHHCPWINGCVGHFNHRYFYLFMAYLWIGCWIFAYFAYFPFLSVAGWAGQEHKDFHSRFRGFIILFFMLSVALIIALGALFAIHTYLVLSNQTTIELYSSGCSICRLLLRMPMRYNDYDLGWKRNLSLFFNTINHPWWLVFLPVMVPPYGDGTVYPNARVLSSL